MMPTGSAVFAVVVAASLVVVVTGKPQQQFRLGQELWIGKAPESSREDDDAPSKPTSVSTSAEGGLKVTPDSAPYTGYIQLQIFLNPRQDGKESVKIHDSNSTFTLPKSFSSSIGSRNHLDDKPCGEGELMHEETGKCYHSGPFTPGVPSPCANEFMEFVQLKDKPGYGECFCLTFQGSSTRPVVYWEKSNRCYWIYAQGPCDKGQWLVFTNTTNGSSQQTKSLACVPRTCPENGVADESGVYPKFWFEHKGKCLQTETSNREFCGNGRDKEKIYFASDKPEPICADIRPLPTGTRGLASGVGYLSCKAGHKKLPNGDCKRVATFE